MMNENRITWMTENCYLNFCSQRAHSSASQSVAHPSQHSLQALWFLEAGKALKVPSPASSPLGHRTA